MRQLHDRLVEPQVHAEDGAELEPVQRRQARIGSSHRVGDELVKTIKGNG